MKNINLSFIQNYYTNSVFLFNWENMSKKWFSCFYYNWHVSDTYKHIASLKTFIYIFFLTTLNHKKILFIIDEDFLKVLSPFRCFDNHYLATNVKTSLDFLNKFSYNQIGLIICLTHYKSFPIFFFRKYNLPIFFFFCFSESGHYNTPVNFSFFSTLVFLGSLFSTILYGKPVSA